MKRNRHLFGVISTYLNVGEMARFLGVSRSTVYNWCHDRFAPQWFKDALNDTNITHANMWETDDNDKRELLTQHIVDTLGSQGLPSAWRGKDGRLTQVWPANDNGQPARQRQDGDDSRGSEEGT